MRRRAAEGRERKDNIDSDRDAAKYHPGLDPLEKEENLTRIQPISRHETDRMTRIVNQMMKARGVTKDEKKALALWKINLAAEGVKGHVHQEFLRDYWAWLLGRGKQKDHDKTPW